MGRTLGYDLNNLRNYLTYNSNNEEIVLSLSEIENIVCGKLPDFLYKKPGHNRFWYNDYNNNPTYAHYWLDAGYYAHCDIDNGIVTFSKSAFKRKATKNEKPIKRVYHANLDINTALNAIKNIIIQLIMNIQDINLGSIAIMLLKNTDTIKIKRNFYVCI